ncbi:MAG: hypothetical protein Q9P01_01455 [Anaerolineae bacterium]|nr:hypothetical protein [Anaerolineae bacterium]
MIEINRLYRSAQKSAFRGVSANRTATGTTSTAQTTGGLNKSETTRAHENLGSCIILDF